jgi:hypothetical protein
MLPAPAARFGGPLTILSKVSWIMLGSPTTVAAFAALASGLCRPLAVPGKIARAALPTNMPGAGRLLPVLGKVARITGMMLFRHVVPPSSHDGTGPSQLERSYPSQVVFTILVSDRARPGCLRRPLPAHDQPHQKQIAQVKDQRGKERRLVEREPVV